MNQNNSELPSEVKLSDDLDFRHLFQLIWRGKWLTLFFLIFFFYLGIQYLKNIPKVYVANSTFGFSEENQNILPKEFSMLSGFVDNRQETSNILTQIKGGNFLRKIVLELKLIEYPEFSKSYDQNNNLNFYQNIKNFIFEKIFAQKTNHIIYTKQEKIEFVVNLIRNEHLRVSKLKNGGFEIKFSSINPKTASTVVNKIVNDYLDLRLNTEISKSEKALSYLSKKLSEAKNELDKSKADASIFALERNVLSAEEFSTQSNRLKEFRNTIEKQTDKIKKLTSLNNYIHSNEILSADYQDIIDQITEIVPRLKRINTSSISKTDLDNLKKELDSLKKRLPVEILRLKESLEITISGFEKLSEKAKQTSSEALILENLNRNLNLATARYEALIKEFENRSLIDGFEKAVGEIYETALPPLVSSYPNRTNFLIIFSIIGIIISFLISILIPTFSNKINSIEKFKKELDSNKIITVSNSYRRFNKFLNLILKDKISSKINKEMLILNALLPDEKIIKGVYQISITTTSFNYAVSAIALRLGYLLSEKENNTLIIDYTNNSSKIRRNIIKNKYKNSNKDKLIELNNNLYFLSKRVENVSEELDKNIEEKNFNYIINVVDKIEANSKNLYISISSDLIFILGLSFFTKISDLRIIKTAIGEKGKFLSGIFVK